MLYAVATDRECRRCREEHGYVTRFCDICIYVDLDTAAMIAAKTAGVVVPLEHAPNIPHHLVLLKGGKPDARYPSERTSTTLPSS